MNLKRNIVILSAHLTLLHAKALMRAQNDNALVNNFGRSY